MTSCFSGSAAKAGLEEGRFGLIGESFITSLEGHVSAEMKGRGDEIVFAEIDVEDYRQGKENVRNSNEPRIDNQANLCRRLSILTDKEE